ncbi:phosphatidate cytidylyltransferase [bacterium BMS3Abin03]|nr:phosphatidate cytidylyltransferase [bacterium BMS3Abin03]
MALGNTTKRVLVSIIAIPAIVLASYFGKIYFLAFVVGIGMIAYFEFAKLVENKKINSNITLGLLAVLVIIINQYFRLIEFYYFTIILIILLTIVELFRNKSSAIANLGATLLGVFYIGLFSSTILMIREYYTGENYIYGGYLIISIFASIWVCDSAAFFGGTALGKHKLLPRVSPKKSWEGAVFGLLFAVITIVICKLIILDFLNWKDIIVIGLIIGTIGQVGDLIESLFKRDADVKDSSDIIPGHGGIFDRFDSLLYTSPVVLLYLEFLR